MEEGVVRDGVILWNDGTPRRRWPGRAWIVLLAAGCLGASTIYTLDRHAFASVTEHDAIHALATTVDEMQARGAIVALLRTVERDVDALRAATASGPAKDQAAEALRTIKLLLEEKR